MFAEERQLLIAELIANAGRVSVNHLADHFSITTETVRRDLAALESSGTVRRVHGGAVAANRVSTTEQSVPERTVQRPDLKLRIAKAALAMVPWAPSGSVLLDAGSTTEALAGLLARKASAATANGSSELMAITHALPIAAKLSNTSGIALQLLGGRVRGLTQAAVGPATVEAALKMRPDIAFIGTNGIHATFGLSTPDPDEAAVKAAFVHSARRIVVLADSSKLNAETLVQFAALNDLDTVITDSQPGPKLTAALADAGVDVVIA